MERKYLTLIIAIVMMLLIVLAIWTIIKGIGLSAGARCGDITSCGWQAISKIWS